MVFAEGRDYEYYRHRLAEWKAFWGLQVSRYYLMASDNSIKHCTHTERLSPAQQEKSGTFISAHPGIEGGQTLGGLCGIQKERMPPS